jgi:hypothetical protein
VAVFSRRLRRIDEPRVAAAGLAVPLLGILAAYVYPLTNVDATPGGIASAVGLVGIAGTGLLYAWRAVTGASRE